MTGAADRLRQTLAAWNATRLALARLSDGRDGDWRVEIVRTRRSLQDQIGAVTRAMTDLGAAGSKCDEYDPCRKALSSVRARLAMHQAEWPAVTIRPDDQDYRLSVAALRQANETFARSAELLMHQLSAAAPIDATKEST